MKYMASLPIFLMLNFNGCSPGGGDRKYYNHTYNLASHIVKMDDKLYFQYYQDNKGQVSNDTNVSLLYEFNNNQWTHIASKEDANISILNDYNKTKVLELYKPFDILKKNIIPISQTEHIIFTGNKAVIKNIDNNKSIEALTLPTADEILNSLSLDVTNGIEAIRYLPFVEKQYLWSKERYLVSIVTNRTKDTNMDDWCRYTEYDISMMKNENTWDYHVVSTRDDVGHRCFSVDIDPIIYSRMSLDGKVNLRYPFFVLSNNNQIKIKKLFGDMYNLEFEKTINSIYAFGSMEIYNGNRGTYTFDEKGNMHLFYNKREDIVNENYEHFWYGYFEKDNPTVPLYEQKILWK